MTSREREELLSAVFGEGDAESIGRCEAWMLAEPRFGAFLQRQREKIRKKARTASGAEGVRDLLAELQVAFHLLRERRFELAYEAYAAAKTRGPDFTVTYKGHIPFNVEVKRIRGEAPQPEAFEFRLVDALCAKLRQMPPSTANVLAIVAERAPEDAELPAMLRRLVLRAEGADAALFARHGFTSARDFFGGFDRLSAVLVRQVSDGAASPLWRNSRARHALHPDVPAILVR